MRRTFRTGLFLIASIATLSSAGVVASHGAIKASGNKLVDASGAPLQLAGMSLYWPLWGGQNFFTSGAITEIATKWNATVVRVPMAVGNGSGSLYTGNTAPIKTAIDAAIANDIYVIIDWHVEQDAPQVDKAVPFFTEMAKTYGNKPNVIFEIWNEPNKASWADIKAYAKTVVGAIRQYSSNLVIVGTPDWSKGVDWPANDPFTDYPNIAYTYHFYACTHGNSYRNVANIAAKKIPLFFTEWGTTEASGGGSVCTSEADAWLSLAKTQGIGWCNWSLSAQNESSAALTPGTSTGGGWSNSNLTASGTYVVNKLKSVVTDVAPSTRSIASLSANRTARGIEIGLPSGSRELSIFDLRGRELSRMETPSQGTLRIPSPGSNALIVRVRTDDGFRTAKLAPLR